MIAGAFFVALLLAAGTDPFVIPLDRDADVFLVDADSDGTGDVAVLDGFALAVYPAANRNATLTLALPPDARAMDIVPHPATGRIVVIAVCGTEIRQFGFEDDAKNGQILFDHESYLSDGERPYRKVLVFERDGESLFFLPSADAIELRTWTGELRERIEPEEPVRRFEKLSGYSRSLPSIGDAGDLEFSVHRSIGNEPAFIAAQWEESSEPDTHSSSMSQREFYALDATPGEWPWFSLLRGGENSPRVRYAIRLHPPETHIRIDTTLSRNDSNAIGPARKFPGLVTRLNAELPDFNGDGYTDLLLWNTNRPSVSPATIARMALRQDWPIRLTVHLFDPAIGRYTARPSAMLNVRATWDALLRGAYGSPLNHVVIQDIDMDGRTDVAFSVDSRTYVRWMMGERGAYTEELQLAEPIEHVSFEQPLDDTGRVTIGLRTKSALYVLDSE